MRGILENEFVRSLLLLNVGLYLLLEFLGVVSKKLGRKLALQVGKIP